MKRQFIIIIFLILLLPACASQKATKSEYDELLKTSIRQLKNYSFDPSSSVESRVKNIPGFVLDYLKKLDEKEDYKNYPLKEEEMNIIIDSINKLPELHKKVFKERLLGIYFVDNFLGSGFAEWVLDDNKQVYCFMVFNPKVLKNNISDWITHKENTCFINDNPDISIEIDCGTAYNGFLYILLHESTHIVDYVKIITPYVEEALIGILGMKIETKEFTQGIWADYSIPEKDYDYNYRKSITFYGFGGGPKINISDSGNVYKQLSQTPFVSIYGSKSWAEDLAEFLAFYHLTQKLNQPYTITVYKGNNPIHSYKPMESAKIKERSLIMEQFY